MQLLQQPGKRGNIQQHAHIAGLTRQPHRLAQGRFRRLRALELQLLPVRQRQQLELVESIAAFCGAGRCTVQRRRDGCQIDA
jgi:hypothetical protein